MEPLSPADQLMLLASIPSVAFTIYYGIFVRWYRTALGWAVFSFSLFVSAILTLIVISVTTGERAPEWIRIAIYGGLFLALTAKLIVLVHEQHVGRIERRRRKANPDHDHRDTRPADTGELTLR